MQEIEGFIFFHCRARIVEFITHVPVDIRISQSLEISVFNQALN